MFILPSKMLMMRTDVVALFEFVLATIFRLPRVRACDWLKSKALGLMGAQIGRGCTFYPGVWIMTGRNLVVGKHVDFARGVLVTSDGGLTIGDRVLIGYNSSIITRNHEMPADKGRIFGAGHVSKPVVIGDDVWIGANCTILPGVHIGEGAVIAAGSVVSKNVSPFAIWAGTPARKIKMRK